ncbi:MAG: hypothetical protein HGA67_03510 [Candidatus Yonathbacteria bacterium]|nr:hypothetical protein [Candidatus Yonathbacteria bacterium]
MIASSAVTAHSTLKNRTMEKIYIFSIYGIIFAVSEDGHTKGTSVVYGFLQDPPAIQERSMIEQFMEMSQKHATQYEIVRIIGQKEKDNLVEIIGRLRTTAASTGDASYWEKAIVCVNEPDFDCFNKAIWEKIDALANSPA